METVRTSGFTNFSGLVLLIQDSPLLQIFLTTLETNGFQFGETTTLLEL